MQLHLRTTPWTPRRRPRLARRGMTLVEVMVALVILTMCVGMLTSTIASTSVQATVNRENAIAVEAARAAIEDMHNVPFEDVFALFNDVDADDPAGPGTAFGPHFDVFGLSAADHDPDGLVGQVILPGAEGVLTETEENELLGLPRDLNGNIQIDEGDRAGDYLVLPVVVRLRWRGSAGVRQFEMATMLAALSKDDE